MLVCHVISAADIFYSTLESELKLNSFMVLWTVENEEDSGNSINQLNLINYLIIMINAM